MFQHSAKKHLAGVLIHVFTPPNAIELSFVYGMVDQQPFYSLQIGKLIFYLNFTCLFNQLADHTSRFNVIKTHLGIFCVRPCRQMTFPESRLLSSRVRQSRGRAVCSFNPAAHLFPTRTSSSYKTLKILRAEVLGEPRGCWASSPGVRDLTNLTFHLCLHYFQHNICFIQVPSLLKDQNQPSRVPQPPELVFSTFCFLFRPTTETVPIVQQDLCGDARSDTPHHGCSILLIPFPLH